MSRKAIVKGEKEIDKSTRILDGWAKKGTKRCQAPFFKMRNYAEMIAITAFSVSRIFSSHKCPATERIIFLSAVNILLGRINIPSRKQRGMLFS